MASLVGNGMSFTKAGDIAGVFNSRDRLLLGVGEEVGNVEHVLRQLAHYYRARANRGRRIKTKLTYPIFLLVFAVFIAPVPLLFGGFISIPGYLGMTVVPLIVTAVVIGLTLRRVRYMEASDYPRWLADLLLKLPLLGRLMVRHARLDMLENLGLLLSAGLPAQKAVHAAVDAVINPVLRDRFRQALDALNAGSEVADALREGGVIDTAEGYPLLVAGEQAGKFDEMLTHYAEQELKRLEASYDFIAEWFPRFMYFFIVAWIASRFF